MITKKLWKETLEEIKKVKNINNPHYYRIKEDKSEVAMEMVLAIFMSPFSILLDLFLLPIQLIYLIIYKILWK